MKISARGVGFWVTVIAAGFVVAQSAIAAIPSSDGTIYSCYNNRTGALRVVDHEAGRTCNARETELRWNQQGPPDATLAATETQIELGAVDSCANDPEWSLGSLCDPNPASGAVNAIGLSAWVDPANYPSTASYSVRIVVTATTGETICARVFDFTQDAPVDGTTVCYTNTTAEPRVWYPFLITGVTLAAGSHQYGVQTSGDSPTESGGGMADLIIDW